MPLMWRRRRDSRLHELITALARENHASGRKIHTAILAIDGWISELADQKK